MRLAAFITTATLAFGTHMSSGGAVEHPSLEPLFETSATTVPPSEADETSAIADEVTAAPAPTTVATAPASDDDVKHVFMWFSGTKLPGLWVAGRAGGWSVPLPYVAADACTAQLHDISPQPLPRADRAEKLAPNQAALSLSRGRYTGSHTYRISFQCETSPVADLLVHLEPSQAELASWGGGDGDTSAIASR